MKVEDGGEEEVGKGTEDGETAKEELTGEKARRVNNLLKWLDH